MSSDSPISIDSLSKRAREVTPGGVHSYARTFDEEINWKSAKGSHITDLSGKEYIDYLQAWGAIILGHCNEEINQTVSTATQQHDLYGYGTTELEVEAAEAVQSHVPSADKVFFGVTGSEVTAQAIRLSRGVTGRRKIVKFQGHYHGWYDSLAMNQLTPRDLLGERDPFTEGLLEEVIEETIVLPFNDLDAVEEAFAEHGDDIAGVILEPVAHNMGCIPPLSGYLEGLRSITEEYGSLLIFDEIITGFRHALGGVQAIEGVTPDLTTMGKSVANGYPISILCGRDEYMTEFAPAGGDVAFGGTYNAHAGSVAAVKQTIDILERGDFYESAIDHRDRLCTGLEDILADSGVQGTVARYGTVFLTYFMDEQPTSYRDILEQDDELYMDFRKGMVDEGVLFVPKKARRNYITAAHDDEDAEVVLEAAKSVLGELR